MLRKTTNIVLILLWTITTTGFTISKHYCGERLVSVTINHSLDTSCCGPERGCCHNEKESIQLKNDYIAAQEFEELSTPEQENLFPVIYSYISNIPVKIKDQTKYYRNSHPPPKLSVILSELQTFRC